MLAPRCNEGDSLCQGHHVPELREHCKIPSISLWRISVPSRLTNRSGRKPRHEDRLVSHHSLMNQTDQKQDVSERKQAFDDLAETIATLRALMHFLQIFAAIPSRQPIHLTSELC